MEDEKKELDNQLHFVAIGFKKKDQYMVTSVKSNIFITIMDEGKESKTYLVSGDIHGMGHALSCPLCSSKLRESGSVISGNGEMMSIILCENCRTIIVCVFDEKSAKAIKRALEIEDDIISHEWGLEQSYIH